MNRSCYLQVAVSLGVITALNVLAFSPRVARAQHFVYNSAGFERQPFVAGVPLLGLDGWSPAIPPFLNPAAAVVTNASSSNGRQSIEVRGSNLSSSGGITAPYDAVGSYRLPLSFQPSRQKPIVLIEADLLLQTQVAPTTGSAFTEDFFSATLAARSAAGATLAEFGLSSSGHALGYGYNQLPGALPIVKEATALNSWHRLGIALDYSGASTAVAYLLNGKPIGMFQTPDDSGILLRTAMVTYALPDDVGRTRDSYTARFDNFRISVHGSTSP